MKRNVRKRILSCLLAVLMAFSGIIPAMSVFAGDGVEGYHDIELFYKETNTIVPTYKDDTAEVKEDYIEYMVEGQELELTYNLIDTEMPNNGYIKWYSETPTLVDVTQEGVVKAFDSSKGAVIHSWLDNEVKTIPLVGKIMAAALEKVLFNEYVDVDTMDTDAICQLVEDAFGSDSLLAEWVDSYQGELVDSLRTYLDNINSNIHVQLYNSDGTLLDDDFVRICVQKNEEWYAAFLPNGTHITNKSQINTTVAVGSTCQLYAITTPVRLEYGCVYSVKSSSVFEQGKVVATVNDSGLVTFKNPGTVTIVVSPDSEQVIENILKLVNYFYEVNGELIDSDKLAGILIDYIGIDMNRNVLAALLDACFAVADIVGDTADPVQLTATAVKIIANLVLQFAYNDTITFTVVEAKPLEDFNITGANAVKEGAQIQLEITDIVPSYGDTTDITWRSSDPSVASVDEKTGVITGRDAGGSLGNLSSQKCTIYAVSAANNIERSYSITVTGKTGKYISDVEIIGESYLEMGQETDYTYSIYPKRVAEGDNLYITWGLVSGEDEEGNPTYLWADSENPAQTEFASIDSMGHYVVLNGGECRIALRAQTGYYLSNGSFYEISSHIREFTVFNGIPVESLSINVTSAKGIASSINGDPVVVDVGGEQCTYVAIKAGTQYFGLGAEINAQVYPSNASNQNLTWVVDNGYYEKDISSDTHTATITQKSGHENADAFNVYAVSADGQVRSNVITVCVSKNSVNENIITDKNKNSISSFELVNGKQADIYHDISFDKSADGTYSACYKCNWYSSDESIFTVKTKNNDNRDATITAHDVGVATLYCVSADNGVMDTCQVTVYPDKDYLREIVKLCDKTVVVRTTENAALYKKYMNRLDLAYYVLYDEPLASQTTCDTYARELLIALYKLGGFVGISGVDVLGSNKTPLQDDFVTINVGSTTSYKKYSYDFDYSINPKNAMYSKIEWSSSNPNISVDKNGKCTPLENEACSAKITCTVTDYMGTEISDSVYIAFAKKAATGITLDTDSIVGGKIGEDRQLKATVKPDSPTGGASCTDVFWTSSDEEIATVDQNGVVYFKEGGDCTIYATTYDGGYTAQCAVNVVTNYTALQLLVQQYNDLALNSANYYPDSWEAFTAAMSKAQNMIDRASSSQNEVDAMYAELEAAYNGLQKYNYIQKIELYLDGEQTQEFYQYDLSVLSEGISYKNAVLDLNVRLYPNNGSYASVKWESSTTDISVSSDGKCTPTSNNACYGRITCTVTDHFGNEFTDSVWVSYSYIPVTSLALSDTSINGAVGTTAQLSCKVYPEGTSIGHIGAASIQDYYWESDNEEIATIDQTGLVTFVSAGATVVRAVSYDGGISAECIVSTDGDRTALRQALDDYKDVDYTNYEYDYGMAFKNAYEAAERAMTDNSYTQAMIDTAASDLVNAYNAAVAHPYVTASSVAVTYTTYKRPVVGSASSVASGTVNSSDAVSVNLSSKYSNYNDYNDITLTAAAYPSNAMYKSIGWNVDSNSSDIKTSVSATSITVTPTKRSVGGWVKLTATIVDHYNRVTTRTVYVTMSDKVCTAFDITEASKTMYATAETTSLAYTISGSPEFADIMWSSSNTDVVTVDSSGNITPVDKGIAVVTGVTLDGGYKDTITITIQTDFSELASKQGEYYDLIQQVKDGYTYTQESLDVLSDAVARAQTMINDGKATQAEVNAMIAELDDAYNSLVLYIPVSSVEIGYEESGNVSSDKAGYIRYSATSIASKSVQLVPIFNDPTAVYTSIEWTSSNKNITIDQDGYLTNKSATAGVTLVTCTVTNAFNKTCSGQAYVTFARFGVTGVSFADEMVHGAPSKTVKLSPVVTNSGNTSLNSSYVKQCSYVSDNEKIATVDSNGVVTFVSQGKANITATTLDGGYTATIIAYTTWDNTALEAAINEASALKYTDYAYDYGMAFKTAYENAQTVYANIDASQEDIDTACGALTEAMANLEGNEFIVPELNLVQGEATLQPSQFIQVSADTKQTQLTMVINENAMVTSTDISTSNEQGVTATIDGNVITITKTADKGSLGVTLSAVDTYGRTYSRTYALDVIEEVIPVTDIAVTANGTEVNGSYVASCGGSYTNFGGITIGYIATPSNANAITGVTYTSSASDYVAIDKSGVISLTTVGKLRSSNTTKITVTVTNADGTSVSKNISVTITKA